LAGTGIKLRHVFRTELPDSATVVLQREYCVAACGGEVSFVRNQIFRGGAEGDASLLLIATYGSLRFEGDVGGASSCGVGGICLVKMTPGFRVGAEG